MKLKICELKVSSFTTGDKVFGGSITCPTDDTRGTLMALCANQYTDLCKPSEVEFC